MRYYIARKRRRERETCEGREVGALNEILHCSENGFLGSKGESVEKIARVEGETFV